MVIFHLKFQPLVLTPFAYPIFDEIHVCDKKIYSHVTQPNMRYIAMSSYHLMPSLLAEKNKNKSTENSASENASDRSNSGLSTGGQTFQWVMGYGRDPRAASSVWPCIAPNGSTGTN